MNWQRIVFDVIIKFMLMYGSIVYGKNKGIKIGYEKAKIDEYNKRR